MGPGYGFFCFPPPRTPSATFSLVGPLGESKGDGRPASTRSPIAPFAHGLRVPVGGLHHGLTVEVWPQAPSGVGLNDWAVELHGSQRSLFFSVVIPGSEHVRPEAYGQFYGHILGPPPVIPPVSHLPSLPHTTPAMVPASSGPIPPTSSRSLGPSPFTLTLSPSSLPENLSQGFGRGLHTPLPHSALITGGGLLLLLLTAVFPFRCP